ncbi:MAP7 domain-containing protein 3 isoform X1 [Pongo pygmaeus]|uniref:MAP7 domain-containing protein 3 isoform X2 n=1 Tax=Pongo abelii TaxID=9601 RepID=UPI0023E1AEF6|nr:MAP7 domain-containing protein 3 isoform X2 [Pongo abelii]XP_054327918.1 MAP7 domain-containing protein 3 isoform X2 [Pongo pygmaeus]
MMADGAAAGAVGSPSLRELRARMVAAANEIAKERRKQDVVNRVATHSSNIRSTFKPVIDGSMLKNDIKQRLARERREEKRRQQDANKETQLLEKERKTKLQYEKQMEERQRKLKERKEKEEQRRIAAEEKRHQKDEAQKEKFTAILYRTLERRRLADDYQQKRWSWGGSAMANSESKTANKRSASTEKLEQGTSALIRQMPLSSAGLQNSVAKRKTDKERSSSLNRRESNLHSSADKEQAERKPRVTGVTNYVMRYVTVPLRKCTSDELMAVMFPMSTMKIPLQTKVEEAPLEKVETPPKASVDAPPQVNVEVFCNTSMEASPKASAGMAPEVSTDSSPMVSVDVSPVVSTYDSEMSMDASPELSIEALLKVHLETVPKVSIEASPEVSLEAPSEVSVEAAPEASVESPPEASLEAPPEVSLEALPEVSVEAAPEGSLEAPPKGSAEVAPKESVKGSPKESMEASPEAMVKASPKTSLEASMEASPKAKARDAPKKSEMDKQALIPIAKKRLSSYTECYKWSSSPANVCGLPSPISTKQIQKNRPPSPLPLISKQSPQTSFPYKIMPIQHTLSVQSASSTVRKKKETVSKTTNRCEALSQRHMICEESGNKSTAGIMNAEAATKILTELRRLAREQREKEEEERQREEMQRRVIKKSKDVAKEAVGGQAEDLLKLKDGQRQKETKKKKGWLDQEDQEAPLQKGDAKIKAQEEADKRKKEHERIMLQNLQERLERKKRIEEIMKRTRKTDVNASKVAETSSHDIYEEAEADNEESDKDSLNEMFPSAILNGTGSPTKFKMPFNNAKKMTHKLVFLEDDTSQVRKEPKTYFNGDLKNFRQKSMKDTSIQEVVSRPSSKRMTSHTTKTRKADETNTTSRSSAQTKSEGFHDILPKSPDTFRR